MSKLPLIIVAAALVFSLPPTARAITVVPTETFTFSGTCTVDCTGTATATLVVENYTGGLSSATFVSFTYTSNFLGTITIDAPTTVSMGGIFVPPLPSAENIGLNFANEIYPPTGSPPLQFETLAGGVHSGEWCIGNNGCAGDSGTSGTWSETPLPAALPLFATGLGALGLLGWRRRRSTQTLA
jgi:hypothetical protein